MLSICLRACCFLTHFYKLAYDCNVQRLYLCPHTHRQSLSSPHYFTCSSGWITCVVTLFDWQERLPLPYRCCYRHHQNYHYGHSNRVDFSSQLGSTYHLCCCFLSSHWEDVYCHNCSFLPRHHQLRQVAYHPLIAIASAKGSILPRTR